MWACVMSCIFSVDRAKLRAGVELNARYDLLLRIFQHLLSQPVPKLPSSISQVHTTSLICLLTLARVTGYVIVTIETGTEFFEFMLFPNSSALKIGMTKKFTMKMEMLGDTIALRFTDTG